MALPASFEEMKERAKELFGEEAEVHYSDDGWVIHTKVEERFDEEGYEDREAWGLYKSNEYGENQLQRWAYKNGHSGESIAELFDSYDEEQEATSRRIVREVREDIASGKIDYDAAPELAAWRDRVLKYAEERGW